MRLTWSRAIEGAVHDALGPDEAARVLLSPASARYPREPDVANGTWQAMVDLAQGDPSRFALAAPKYALAYDGEDYHLSPAGSRALGQDLADAWAEWRARGVLPTRAPLQVARTETYLEITYDLAADEALVWDDRLWGGHHPGAWAAARGFEVLDAAGAPVPIDGAEIVGEGRVRLTRAAGWPGGTLHLSYACYADAPYGLRRGQLRTSAGRWIAQSERAVP